MEQEKTTAETSPKHVLCPSCGKEGIRCKTIVARDWVFKLGVKRNPDGSPSDIFERANMKNWYALCVECGHEWYCDDPFAKAIYDRLFHSVQCQTEHHPNVPL